MQQRPLMDIERDKKRPKAGIWIGSILCVGSFVFFLVWLIMILVLGPPQKNQMTFIPLMAITMFILAPLFLLGLALVFYGVLKQKNIEHAGLIVFLCLILVVAVLILIVFCLLNIITTSMAS